MLELGLTPFLHVIAPFPSQNCVLNYKSRRELYPLLHPYLGKNFQECIILRWRFEEKIRRNAKRITYFNACPISVAD